MRENAAQSLFAFIHSKLVIFYTGKIWFQKFFLVGEEKKISLPSPNTK